MTNFVELKLSSVILPEVKDEHSRVMSALSECLFGDEKQFLTRLFDANAPACANPNDWRIIIDRCVADLGDPAQKAGTIGKMGLPPSGPYTEQMIAAVRLYGKTLTDHSRRPLDRNPQSEPETFVIGPKMFERYWSENAIWRGVIRPAISEHKGKTVVLDWGGFGIRITAASRVNGVNANAFWLLWDKAKTEQTVLDYAEVVPMVEACANVSEVWHNRVRNPGQPGAGITIENAPQLLLDADLIAAPRFEYMRDRLTEGFFGIPDLPKSEIPKIISAIREEAFKIIEKRCHDNRTK